MKSNSLIKDELFFLSKFIKKPKIIGSICPSSKFLASRILEPIQWDKIRSIVELGAGTGVLTAHISKLKTDNCNAFIFELDNDMRNKLKTLYPGLIFHKDARSISKILHENDLSGTDCIISGLPYALLPKSDRDTIIKEVVNSLNNDGVFIAFQYSLQMKRLLKKQFSRVEISFEPRNIPPAFIYKCHK